MSKHILVVGGSTGIGLALIHELLHEGYKIHTMCRHRGEIPDDPSCHFYEFDIEGTGVKYPDIKEHFDGLVYLPGTITMKPFRSLSDQDFLHDWQLNFLGAVRVIRHYFPNLEKSEQASIVLLGSVAADQGIPFHTSISAAKGAVEAFTRSLAAEYAPKIRVNAVSPSLTETPLSEKITSNEERKEKTAKRHPMQRIGHPEDIASVIKFLLSDESSWITGQTMHSDGGLSTIKLLT
ncbi:MAG: SDR family oxidoreductase [Chlamydiales bacterium]